MSSEILGKISTIAYGPVKGARQIEAQSVQITESGIVGDKEYVITKDKPDDDGVYRWISQREYPKLALLVPGVSDGMLSLSHDEKEILYLDRNKKGKEMTVQIWEDIVKGAIDQGNFEAEWLSDFLGTGVRLVRSGENHNRPVSKKWGDNDSHNSGFQDSYPVHWFTQASLDELNQRIVKNGRPRIDWKRFRPNIIVDGETFPDIEHKVLFGNFGEIPFKNQKPCDRCPVPTIDQSLGKRVDGEPLATLASYKRWRKPTDNKVFVIFGENALPQKSGRIEVGEEVVVDEFDYQRVIYGGVEIKPIPKH